MTGRNALNGSIPSFFVDTVDGDDEPEPNSTQCQFPLNPFSKIGLSWIKKTSTNITTSFGNLKILSLCKCNHTEIIPHASTSRFISFAVEFLTWYGISKMITF